MIIHSKHDGWVKSVRLVYDMGGSSTPSTTTQTTDLPDWAKPYAQEALERGKTLSSAPYQRYDQPRFAGFSDMQTQAQKGVSGMQTSGLGNAGGMLSGAATLGALGTSYNPYQTGQFNSQAAGQYMNPYLEQAMAPQLREAQRSSDILGTQQAGQAVKQGAFGGSRAGLLEAERGRNTAMQQDDIRARGYQSAYDKASDQFGRDQQLREQSRQFGSSLGMQGLQTALQGAGQMSNIGNQQFNQQKDIYGLQNQFGREQQDLRQKGLSQSYQDFLDEKNDPYKRLGFFSDLIRGLPLGQQSTSQIYQAPGSMMGQLGGLGMGVYGMSKMADGGSVTSDYKVDSILSSLSDEQLQQARQSAMQSQDQHRLEMIDTELAERASIRSGIGGAFNSLPEETQASVTEMASGGIIAFADEGLVSDPMGTGASEIAAAGTAPPGRSIIEYLTNEPQWKADLRRERENEAAAKAAPKPAPKPTPKVEPEPVAKKEVASKPAAPISRKNASEAVSTLAAASKVELPKDDTRALSKSLFEEMMAKSNSEKSEFKADLDAAKNRAKEIEARGIGEAMMKFGFGMAASAAKPGVARRAGIAGALESAASAAPIFAESMAENQKLQQAAQDNYMKLRMDNAKYQTALEQGNMQLAATMANNISQRQLTQAQLQEQIAQHERMFGLEKEKLGIMRSQAGQGTSIQKIASDLQAADPSLDRRAALNEASRISGYSFKSEQTNELKRAETMEKLRKASPMYGVLEMQLTQAKTPAERAEIQQKLNDIEARATGKLASGVASAGANPAYPGFKMAQ
jgi:hypothetical protein